MRTAVVAGLALIVVPTLLQGAHPQYHVSPLPANTLLNNNGLIAVPPELRDPNMFVTAVNDHGEFTWVRREQRDWWVIQTYGIYLPSPAHGLPAGVTVISPFPDEYGGPMSINNHGQVVGHSHAGEASFLWLPEPAYGLPPGLTTMNPSQFGWAFGEKINDHGQTLVRDFQGADKYFIWLPEPDPFGNAAGFKPLPDSAGIVSNLNKFGAVVGQVSRPELNAFLWLPGAFPTHGLHVGGINNLTMPPTAGPSPAAVALGINDLFQVVGSYDGTAGYRAFIWDVANGTADLNTLIPAGSGWVLEYATQINNRGDIIGTGTYFGQPASFFLSIPEPSLFISAPSILLLRGRGRRQHI